MFNLFRPRLPRKQPKHQYVHINGSVYFRRGSDVIRLEPGDRAGDGKICSGDHVAPNGVAIAQIAYAIALAEGMIAVTHDPCSDSRSMRSELGLN